MTHQVKIRFIAVILAFMSSTFFAEDLPGIDEDVPPPPVVSQLSAKTDGGDVLLAWEPVAGITGTSIICAPTARLPRRTICPCSELPNFLHTNIIP